MIGPDGDVVDEVRRPTPKRSPELLDTLAGIAAELRPWSSIGVGLPGLITWRGVMTASPHLGAMAGLDIRSGLEELGVADVWVANDATCAMQAEWSVGAAIGATDAVMVTLGTGIGGGIVAGGSLVVGRNGYAGEFGHMVVDPDGPPCPCGRRGCWERYASGTGLARLARDAALGGRIGRVVELAGGDMEAVRGEHLQQAAREGDRFALAVVDEFARWVAVGLSNLTNALDPELFVLGGGLAAGADLYLDPIERWFGELLYAEHLRPKPEIRFARLGEHAGAIGAAFYAAAR